MIVVVPVETAVTIPEAEPMVATEVALLAQTPPAYPLSICIVPPIHTTLSPVIVVGVVTTFIGVSTKHPVGSVYRISTIPVATVDTIPVLDPIVAIDGLPLLHTPPVAISLRVIVEPRHTRKVLELVIDEGKGFTVKAVVKMQPVKRV